MRKVEPFKPTKNNTSERITNTRCIETNSRRDGEKVANKETINTNRLLCHCDVQQSNRISKTYISVFHQSYLLKWQNGVKVESKKVKRKK